MKTTSITHVAHLVEICVQKGISQVVISPGSRNAPLIIAFDNHPAIEVFLIHDERSAGFFALGLAEQSNQPVAITCTSGSAPLNYAPAISEAYYRNIPLLVLTADRPVELIDQGDGQTIRQKNVFNNYIKAAFETPNFPNKDGVLKSDLIVNKAINEVLEIPRGPVQINIPLAEPLYEVQDLNSVPILVSPKLEKEALTEAEIEDVSNQWSNADRKLILIGQLQPNYLEIEKLKHVLSDPSVAVLVENTSNIQDFQ
jgi:2-succinyl-5-enolpyruvyl-6-hydroxy-3-cyclohexene-1-carboxylate synthase